MLPERMHLPFIVSRKHGKKQWVVLNMDRMYMSNSRGRRYIREAPADRPQLLQDFQQSYASSGQIVGEVGEGLNEATCAVALCNVCMSELYQIS